MSRAERFILHVGGRGAGKEILRSRGPKRGVVTSDDESMHAILRSDDMGVVTYCETRINWNTYLRGPDEFDVFRVHPQHRLCVPCVAGIEREVRP